MKIIYRSTKASNQVAQHPVQQGTWQCDKQRVSLFLNTSADPPVLYQYRSFIQLGVQLFWFAYVAVEILQNWQK
eukprot:15335118-Ditylum_brightwellii.AAC.1